MRDLPELAQRILDHVRNHGRVTTRDMVRIHNASPNTLKSTFGNLVEKKLLVRERCWPLDLVRVARGELPLLSRTITMQHPEKK